MYKKFTNSGYLYIFYLLELPHARPVVCLHALPLRNIANEEKNGRPTINLGYVVVEITKKKEKIKSSPSSIDRSSATTASTEINSKNTTERTSSSSDRIVECISIFSSLIAHQHTLWKARRARQ